VGAPHVFIPNDALSWTTMFRSPIYSFGSCTEQNPSANQLQAPSKTPSTYRGLSPSEMVSSMMGGPSPTCVYKRKHTVTSSRSIHQILLRYRLCYLSAGTQYARRSPCTLPRLHLDAIYLIIISLSFKLYPAFSRSLRRRVALSFLKLQCITYGVYCMVGATPVPW
jgi:hypothetical protein